METLRRVRGMAGKIAVIGGTVLGTTGLAYGLGKLGYYGGELCSAVCAIVGLNIGLYIGRRLYDRLYDPSLLKEWENGDNNCQEPNGCQPGLVGRIKERFSRRNYIAAMYNLPNIQS